MDVAKRVERRFKIKVVDYERAGDLQRLVMGEEGVRSAARQFSAFQSRTFAENLQKSVQTSIDSVLGDPEVTFPMDEALIASVVRCSGV